MQDVKRITVVGSGTMGSGIALLFASKGFNVTIFTRNIVNSNAIALIRTNLELLSANDIVAAGDIPSILDRVKLSDSLRESAESADLIIENAIEDLATKQEYFKQLDEICDPHTILATNTSVISITEIAEKSVHKERIIGTHFWNPPFLIPLVEVVKTEDVSDDIVAATYRVLEQVGRKPVIVQKDVPGFLANRLQHALFREAISIVEHGIASAKDVDDAIKYGFGLRLPVAPPMTIIDNGGADLTLSIHQYIFPYLENSTKPSPLLVEKVETNELGFKTGGVGFQTWTEEEMAQTRADIVSGIIKVGRAFGRI